MQAGNVLNQQTLGSPVELLVALLMLALVPVLAISVTSFTRIVVVLGLLRASLGTAALPPNAVIVAIAVMLSRTSNARVTANPCFCFFMVTIPTGIRLLAVLTG